MTEQSIEHETVPDIIERVVKWIAYRCAIAVGAIIGAFIIVAIVLLAVIIIDDLLTNSVC